MHPQEFQQLVAESVGAMGIDQRMDSLSQEWMTASLPHRYTYNFSWMGLPIIQYPQDIITIQELIWRIKPSLIVETGVARGGSLLLSATMLMLCDLSDHQKHTEHSTGKAARRVVGIDIDIRDYARAGLMNSPLLDYVELIEGSSVDAEIVEEVRRIASSHQEVMVLLDSDHTHDHVLQELEAYSDLVSSGSYCVVFDTGLEDFPSDQFPDRPWGPGNSPRTAVKAFLETHADFEVDTSIHARNQITSAPGGYLRRR